LQQWNAAGTEQNGTKIKEEVYSRTMSKWNDIFLNSVFRSDEIKVTEPKEADDNNGATLNSCRILARRLIGKRLL